MFEFESKGTTYAMMQFDGEYRRIQKSYKTFLRWLTVFEILAFQVFDLENLGQDH